MSDQAIHAPAPSRWIQGPATDLLLFIATPLLIIPAVALALHGLEGTQIEAVVLAFGALGHNLPGMLRAYGDRALFRRFRARFILAPIVLGGTTFAFFLSGRATSILLIVFVWAAWHALMQVYGFSRIYDAKVGATAPRTARMDLLLVVAWFGGAIALSDARVYHLQELLIHFGVAPMATATLDGVRTGCAVLLGAVTAAYLANEVAQRRAGVRVSPLKHLLLGTSIGFWWYVHFVTDNVLLGLVMFEVFHDVQYLAIVWIFNRKRVDGGAEVGGFTRFLFRNSYGMMGIYLALVFAYGGLSPLFGEFGFGKSGQPILGAFIVSSGLLHYYFDGFIWKVRESSTRRALGVLDSGSGDPRVPLHAVKWLLFLVPCGVLWGLGEHPPPPLEKATVLIESTPRAAQGQTGLGRALTEAERYEDSIAPFERCLAIVPDDRGAQRNLSLAELFAGRNLWLRGDRERAEPLLRRAYARNPVEVIDDCNQQALRLVEAGRHEDAILHLQVVAFLQPDSAEAHVNLGVVYVRSGKKPLASREAKQALALVPDHAGARRLLRSLDR